MSSDPRWYVQKNGKASGPFNLSDLRDQVRQNSLQGHDLVFQDGASEWKRAFDWPELATVIFSEQKTSFTGLFTLPPAEGAGSDQWVVLIRRQEGKSLRFDQEGPLETAKIRDLLRTGKAQPSDHVWKTGLSQWVAIFTLPEFSPNLWNVSDQSAKLLQSVVETPAAKAPVSTPEVQVTRVEPAPKPPEPAPTPVMARPSVVPTPPPAAARTETPVPNRPAQTSAAPPVAPVAKPAPPASAPPKPVATATFQLPEHPRDEFHEFGADATSETGTGTGTGIQQKTSTWTTEKTISKQIEATLQTIPAKLPLRGKEWVLAALAIVAVVGVFPRIKHRFFDRVPRISDASTPINPIQAAAGDADQASSSPEGPPESKIENQVTGAPGMDLPPGESVAAATPAPALPPPTVAPAPPVAAAPKIANPKSAVPKVVATRSLRNVSWSFSLPGASGSSLLVIVTGSSGQILDLPAVNLRLNLFLPENRRLQLDPKSLKLPEGRYQVQIYQNGRQLVRAAEDYILDSAQFDKKILMHRKQIAYDQQTEKRSLLKSLDGLQKFVNSHKQDFAVKTKTAGGRASLLRSLAALNRSEAGQLHQQRNSLMYLSGWTAFATQYESLHNLLSEAGSLRRPTAKADLEGIRKKIVQARTQVSQTSLWPD